MEKSKVYFTSMKTSFSENLPQKLERLMKTAGIGSIDLRISMPPSKSISENPEIWLSCGPIMRQWW